MLPVFLIVIKIYIFVNSFIFGLIQNKSVNYFWIQDNQLGHEPVETYVGVCAYY